MKIYNKLVLAVLPLTISMATADCQTLSARLELEAVMTRDFGKVLSVKVVIENQSNVKLFLDNFIRTAEIEKFDTEKKEFQNYFDCWFAEMIHDPNRKQIEVLVGSVPPDRDHSFELLWSKEMMKYNMAVKDSATVKYWVDSEVERIEALNPGETYEFPFYLNNLPTGSYRIGFHYSNLKNSIRYHPVEKFHDIRMPDSLLGYTRWKGGLDSNQIYLTIK